MIKKCEKCLLVAPFLTYAFFGYNNNTTQIKYTVTEEENHKAIKMENLDYVQRE